MGVESMDFFRDDELVADPYPYLAALRGYEYVPTFILRGLTELHLEFTL